MPLLLNLILKLSYFIIVTLHSNLELSCPHLIYVIDLGFQALNCLLDCVKSDLLNKDFIGDRDVVQGLLLNLLLRSWVKVFDTEASECTVNANREELAVIIVQLHTLNLSCMSLHFHSLLHRVISIAEHLNRTGAVWLSQACIEQVTHVANKNLGVC